MPGKFDYSLHVSGPQGLSRHCRGDVNGVDINMQGGLTARPTEDTSGRSFGFPWGTLLAVDLHGFPAQYLCWVQ